MGLNYYTRIGILLCLYLSRSGRANLSDVAESLRIDLNNLYLIADTLLEHKVINFVFDKGYELNENITFFNVLYAIEGTKFMQKHEYFKHSDPSMEHRALAVYDVNLGLALAPVLNRTIKNAMLELIANEVKLLDRNGSSGTSH
jgi:hypothetical protein